MTTRGDGRTVRDAWTALRFALLRTALCVLAVIVGSGGMVALRGWHSAPSYASVLAALLVVLTLGGLLCGLFFGGWAVAILVTALLQGGLGLAGVRLGKSADRSETDDGRGGGD
ncbi:hypothetical protein QQY66_49015 [Streptomyces sp. DG2A-72]|uniref:hypothetical protein n=1 Tax=Streptomyces sp. DG2A-72 TaxID=3051386 RepID=UPI00265B90F2|nr:hypothetical protein [Streptomyces sp. DG2A-72]MDO0939255.1 hypothetical protein [Streptomyces sp. DG2A-72]